VTETKETPRASRASTILAKWAKLRVSRSTLYTTMVSTLVGFDVREQPLEGRADEIPT
jgi:hypothetical protein